MTLTISQYKQFVNCNYELKEKMKEEFYKQKIQEAKDKKNVNGFRWNELPFEVVEIIKSFKEKIELVYIPQAIKTHHLTYKSFREFIFHEYKNEHNEGLKSIPAVNKNFKMWIWAMINKKPIYKELYDDKDITVEMEKIENKYKDITENKTPSLEDYIDYRNKQRKENSKIRKEKAKREEIVSEFKVGDLITIKNRLDYKQRKFIGSLREHYEAYIITGETKTQFRVDKIDWTEIRQVNTNYWTHTYYALRTDKDCWIKRKGQNIGKKSYIYKLEVPHPRDFENPFIDGKYYTYEDSMGSD